VQDASEGKKGQEHTHTHTHQHAHMCVVSAAEKARHEWRERRKRVLKEMMQSQRVQDGAKDALVYRHQVMQRKCKKGEMVK